MTIKEFKEFLNKYPDNMEIIETRYSDMRLMNPDKWKKVKVIDVSLNRGYIMFYPEDDF